MDEYELKTVCLPTSFATVGAMIDVIGSCIQNLDSPQHRLAMGRHVSGWQIERLEHCVRILRECAAESEKAKRIRRSI